MHGPRKHSLAVQAGKVWRRALGCQRTAGQAEKQQQAEGPHIVSLGFVGGRGSRALDCGWVRDRFASAEPKAGVQV